MYQGKNYINGEWRDVTESYETVNPATEEVYGTFPNRVEEAGLAVTAARESFDSWRKESRVRRAEYFDVLAQLIKRDHDKLKDAISIETGKNLNESHAEVIETLPSFERPQPIMYTFFLDKF